MQGRRYPEGGEVPDLDLTVQSPDEYTYVDTIRSNRRDAWFIPVSLDNLSSTSNAKDCFVDRNNSLTLQKFLLNYSYTLVTTRVLSGEV